MSISRQTIEEKLSYFTREFTQKNADLNALSGAIQLCQGLLADLDKAAGSTPAPAPAPDANVADAVGAAIKTIDELQKL